MKNPLFLNLYSFFKSRQGKAPASYLLAFSGGADSTALLFLLKDLQEKLSFEFDLAHVDHGMREESKKEAEQLKSLADTLGLRFFSKQLLQPEKGNLEEVYREERIEFFKSLFKKRNYHAVLIAHHRDDLEETVLKRILEGASLDKLSGMKKVSQWGDLTFYRPLLDFPKKCLLEYLKNKEQSYFFDQTNEDVRFLRARMRKEIIFQLENSFGKKIRSNLVRVSKQANALSHYLESQVENRYLFKEGPLGLFLDFSQKNLHPFEMQYVIKKYFDRHDINISKETLDKIIEALKSSKPFLSWPTSHESLFTEQKRIFYFHSVDELTNQKPLSLSNKLIHFGHWKSQVIDAGEFKDNIKLGWERLFDEKPSFCIPMPSIKRPLSLSFSVPHNERFYFGKRLKRWWSDHKIPPNLRNLLPLLCAENKIYADFLSKKIPFEYKKTENYLYLSYEKALK